MPLARLSARLLPVPGSDYAGKTYASPGGATTGLAGYSLEGQRERRNRRRLARLAARRGEVRKTTDSDAYEAATSPFNLKPEPTENQARAGNYPKGHVRIAGLDVSIENPAGSRRQPEWSPLTAHYGYVRRTEGADGEQLDAFVRPGVPEDYDGPVYVVDQVDPRTGAFDEHKALIGWRDEDSARRAYLSNYEPGWAGLGAITEMSVAEFRAWLRGDSTQPLALRRRALLRTARP